MHAVHEALVVTSSESADALGNRAHTNISWHLL